MKLCNENCKGCLTKGSNLYSMAYFILAKIERVDHNFDAGRDVERYCPELSICPVCLSDDFKHIDGCEMAEELDRGGK